MTRATLSIRRFALELSQTPLGSKLGFVVIVLGLVIDVIAHITAGVEHDHSGATSFEVSGHLVVFVGMVIVLIGVIFDGLRQRRVAQAAAYQKESSKAVR